jgi:type II secretory pathway component PulJ
MTRFYSGCSARFRSRSGLTVLELVSALALFVIILGTLLIAVNAANDIWSHSNNKNKGQLQMRRVMEMMTDDLTCAVGQRQAAAGDVPWFIIDYPRNATNQCALYFVKAVSPLEIPGGNKRSLELVGYRLTTVTNVLSRYTGPVSLNSDVGSQLATFRTAIENLSSPTNVLSALAVTFGITAYTNSPPAASFTPPESYNNAPGTRVNLYDIPDFVDIGIAYIDASQNRDDAANSYVKINYMTRRVTLPAAQASRLP